MRSRDEIASDTIAALERRLEEMTKDRDYWKDSAVTLSRVGGGEAAPESRPKPAYYLSGQQLHGIREAAIEECKALVAGYFSNPRHGITGGHLNLFHALESLKNAAPQAPERPDEASAAGRARAPGDSINTPAVAAASSAAPSPKVAKLLEDIEQGVLGAHGLTTEEMDTLRGALRQAAAPVTEAKREDFIQVSDTLDVAECCVHDQIKNPLEREETQKGLKRVRELALSALRGVSATEGIGGYVSRDSVKAETLRQAAGIARESYPKDSCFDERMKIAAHSIAGTLDRMADSCGISPPTGEKR